MTEADTEKKRAAASSVIASLALTLLKFAAGIITGSLGVLSSAVDSALDVGVSSTTFYAVKLSAKPPDKEHRYGHAKVESLTGFAEGIILLGVCSWLIYQAYERIVFRTGYAEPGYIGFAVLAVSVLVDFSRSRLLSRVGRKYDSQALQADALHFTIDLLISALVIVGLIFVRLGYGVADAVVALTVSAFIIYAALRLLKRTVDALLDRAPEALVRLVERQVAGFAGLVKYDRLRVRRAGTQTFVDVRVFLPRTMPLEKAHDVASELEKRLQSVVSGADVIVHVEPVEMKENIADKIRLLATDVPKIKNIHDIKVAKVGKGLQLDMHVEVREGLRLDEAHRIVQLFENMIKHRLREISSVITHIEPETETPIDQTERPAPDSLIEEVTDVVSTVSGVKDCKDLTITTGEEGVIVEVICSVQRDVSVGEAHRIASEVEDRIKRRVGNVSRVTVHTEPLQKWTN